MGANEDWKAKLESAYSFMLRYSKITVWSLKEMPPKQVWCWSFEVEGSYQSAIQCIFKSTLMENHAIQNLYLQGVKRLVCMDFEPVSQEL